MITRHSVFTNSGKLQPKTLDNKALLPKMSSVTNTLGKQMAGIKKAQLGKQPLTRTESMPSNHAIEEKISGV